MTDTSVLRFFAEIAARRAAFLGQLHQYLHSACVQLGVAPAVTGAIESVNRQIESLVAGFVTFQLNVDAALDEASPFLSLEQTGEQLSRQHELVLARVRERERTVASIVRP